MVRASWPSFGGMLADVSALAQSWSKATLVHWADFGRVKVQLIRLPTVSQCNSLIRIRKRLVPKSVATIVEV